MASARPPFARAAASTRLSGQMAACSWAESTIEPKTHGYELLFARSRPRIAGTLTLRRGGAMPVAPHILAIDLGTTGPKVALVSVDGEVLDCVFEPTALHLFADGGAEQDPHDWWRAIVAGSRRLVGAHPPAAAARVPVALT